jgi:hypothetical protein
MKYSILLFVFFRVFVFDKNPVAIQKDIPLEQSSPDTLTVIKNQDDLFIKITTSRKKIIELKNEMPNCPRELSEKEKAGYDWVQDRFNSFLDHCDVFFDKNFSGDGEEFDALKKALNDFIGSANAYAVIFDSLYNSDDCNINQGFRRGYKKEDYVFVEVIFIDREGFKQKWKKKNFKNYRL